MGERRTKSEVVDGQRTRQEEGKTYDHREREEEEDEDETQKRR